ncbi:interactor of HORMAD1 protein 1 [Corythoichthys intestinalis]|uniref:interactor of HORMAD1 protein 1 n=1 Tax=Corythoichthys intestinalis TaxID=161448 RepID=UPI0025A4E8A6|nr:interactor of HORMAD1 protein 1 [Corythoichthys intestinalis]
MNHTVNIKELLNKPSTGSRYAGTNFTDSQFSFGSQFWRENSQWNSPEMSLLTRSSQHSSQEFSDPKISTRYRSKPLLFGDPKDKETLLDTFEEAKKKAKERYDSDMIARECLQIREAMTKIQQLVSSTEENATVCQTSLQMLSNLSSTLQIVHSSQSNISQQFEMLLNTVSFQKETMTELDERVKKNEENSLQLVSNMQNDVESLRLEQEKANLKQASMLEEALQLLNAIVSEHSGKLEPIKVTDKAMQTSPGQDKGIQTAQNSYAADIQSAAFDLAVTMRKKKPSSRYKRRPLVRQGSRPTVTDENSQLLNSCRKRQNISRPLKNIDFPDILLQQKPKSSSNTGCMITPLSCWSQESSSPESTRKIKPTSEMVQTDSSPNDALWQLFKTDKV